jgi:hypothetical protein
MIPEYSKGVLQLPRKHSVMETDSVISLNISPLLLCYHPHSLGYSPLL